MVFERLQPFIEMHAYRTPPPRAPPPYRASHKKVYYLFPNANTVYSNISFREVGSISFPRKIGDLPTSKASEINLSHENYFCRHCPLDG